MQCPWTCLFSNSCIKLLFLGEFTNTRNSSSLPLIRGGCFMLSSTHVTFQEASCFPAALFRLNTRSQQEIPQCFLPVKRNGVQAAGEFVSIRLKNVCAAFPSATDYIFQVWKLHSSVLTQKNTDSLARIARDTAGTTGSSRNRVSTVH